jgi:hypothetical protein
MGSYFYLGQSSPLKSGSRLDREGDDFLGIPLYHSIHYSVGGVLTKTHGA